jgi:alcohol dehydrogenase class IV
VTVDPFAYRGRSVEVRFGRGLAAAAVGDFVAAREAHRVLLVASTSRPGALHPIVDVLGARLAARFSDIEEHVPSRTAALAYEAAVSADADLILCVGGGSTTGTAKAIALRTGLPIFAVPTTLAGSEMTDTWGITTDGKKKTGTAAAVLPRGVVYDSELLDAVPVPLAVVSGFNAMAHCIEAFWGPRRNPLSSLMAGEGIRRLAEGLRGLDDRRTDALDDLQFGSFLAGTVFAEAGSGLHHKICHALGGALDLPHAATHTVVLPHVVRFNAGAVPRVADEIARALGASTADEGLEDLIAAVRAPRTLKELGMTDDDLDTAIDAVAEKLPIPNPREVTRESLAALLQVAYDGKEPSR